MWKSGVNAHIAYGVLVINAARSRVELAQIRRLAARALHAGKFPSGSTLSVIFVTSVMMRTLNAKWRRKDKATTVLAFPFGRGARFPGISGGEFLGEIYISPRDVQNFASERGQTYSRALAELLVHGIVHLKGYDHATGKEAVVMERMENRLMRSLGSKVAIKFQ